MGIWQGDPARLIFFFLIIKMAYEGAKIPLITETRFSPIRKFPTLTWCIHIIMFAWTNGHI